MMRPIWGDNIMGEFNFNAGLMPYTNNYMSGLDSSKTDQILQTLLQKVKTGELPPEVLVIFGKGLANQGQNQNNSGLYGSNNSFFDSAGNFKGLNLFPKG
jgi:hypothetical protein